MSRTLVFDTETTGLPPRKCSLDDSVSWNKCRIVQIAWHVYDGDVLEASYNTIIKPDGFTIPDFVSNIHGITDEIADREGIPIEGMFERLQDVLPTVDTIVAHNIKFDDNVLLSEMYRYKKNDMIDSWISKKKVCTMMMAKPYQQNNKWLKLSELYRVLFDEEPSGRLHSADTDVALCARCYLKMIS